MGGERGDATRFGAAPGQPAGWGGVAATMAVSWRAGARPASMKEHRGGPAAHPCSSAPPWPQWRPWRRARRGPACLPAPRHCRRSCCGRVAEEGRGAVSTGAVGGYLAKMGSAGAPLQRQRTPAACPHKPCAAVLGSAKPKGSKQHNEACLHAASPPQPSQEERQFTKGRSTHNPKEALRAAQPTCTPP